MTSEIKLVGGALFKNGKLLVVKRSSGKKLLPNYWEIPGGHVETGETQEEAVKREFLEETGLTVKVGEMFTTWTWKSNDETYVETDYFLECNDVSKITLNPQEHSEYKWMEKNEGGMASEEMHASIAKAFEATKE